MQYRKISDRRAKVIAKELGLKKQINSGAIAGKKGDIYGPDILIEDKILFNRPKNLSIKRSWVDKIIDEAFSMGKTFWALFLHDNEDHRGSSDLVVISRRTFDTFYEAYKEQEKLKHDLV